MSNKTERFTPDNNSSKTERFTPGDKEVSKTQRFQPANSNLGATIRQSVDFVLGKKIPNYTLLFLDPTAKHQTGGIENIVVPNITIGRSQKCHVSYSDKYNTVSREHASITTDEESYVINHNPNASNPTLVNGKEITAPTNLNNGDEIQFSVNGPRVRFMSAQGGQSSGPGFTARLGSAISQAVRPYKTAMVILSIILLGAVGLAGYSIYKNTLLSDDLVQSKIEMDVLNEERIAGNDKIESLELKLRNTVSKKEADIIRKQLVESKREQELNKQQILLQQKKIAEQERKQQENEIEESISPEQTSENEPIDAQASETDQASSSKTEDLNLVTNEDIVENEASFNTLASNDVYYLVAKRIDYMTSNGFDSKSATGLDKGLWSGTAFLTNNGKLITARHNIQPWRFFTQESKEFKSLFQDISKAELETGDVNVKFELYGNEGLIQTLESKDIIINDENDKIVKQKLLNTKFRSIRIKMCQDLSYDWAYFDFNKAKGNILEANSKEQQTLPLGSKVWALAYQHPMIEIPKAGSLTKLFEEGKLAKSRGLGKLFTANNINIEQGSSGGPVIAYINNQYKVIGLVSAQSTASYSVIVPIGNIDFSGK